VQILRYESQDGLGLSAVVSVVYLVVPSYRNGRRVVVVDLHPLFFTINSPVFLASQYNQHNGDVTRVTEKSFLYLSGRIYPIKATEELLLLLLVSGTGVQLHLKSSVARQAPRSGYLLIRLYAPVSSISQHLANVCLHELASRNKTKKFTSVLTSKWGTRWRSWLRHCATTRKVTGSIPDCHWIFY